MLSKEEVEKVLDCSKCKLKECIGCEITYTDRKKIKEYIEQLENKFNEFVKVEQTVDSINFSLPIGVVKEIDKSLSKTNIALENKRLKSREQKLIDKLEADKMEQFDDYVIYLIESYLAILKGER